jgi:UDP-N-acetylmuramyl pentapeptide phosphotransferase/UDP-N-acetylglucosamine-1-phosphate transferase
MTIQGSKFYYYVWLILVLTGLIVGILVFNDLFKIGKTDAAAVMSVWNATFFMYTFFAIKKYVYVEQKEDKIFQIGNIFFKETISIDHVEIRKIFIPNTYKIKYKDKAYWFISVVFD